MKSSNCKSTDKIGFSETNLCFQGQFAGSRKQYVAACIYWMFL